MRKFTVICLLVSLAGCGSDKKEEGQKQDGEQNAVSIPAMPFVPVSWNPQEEATQEEVAQEEAAQEEASEETIESIIEEFDSAMSEFRKEYNAAESPADKREIFSSSYPQPKEYCERLMKVVEDDPSTDEASEALSWVTRNDRGKLARRANKLLMEFHMDSEAMADIAMTKSREVPSTENQAFLKKLIEESPVERVKGVASYARVMQLQNGQRNYDYQKKAAQAAEAAADTEEGEEADPRIPGAKKRFERFMASLDEDAKSYYETGKTTDGVDLIGLMEAVNDTYGDVVLMKRGDRKTTISDRCEGTLFELRYLAIGKVAPEIEGEDLDGVEFKLSDYRGKVVVIDFWGDW